VKGLFVSRNKCAKAVAEPPRSKIGEWSVYLKVDATPVASGVKPPLLCGRVGVDGVEGAEGID
jgi:hypothetical protein